MKATLIVNGKEIEVEIAEKDAEAMTGKKRTGYERVEQGKIFFRVLPDGMVIGNTDEHIERDNAYFENGNYYSHHAVAENNARADKLMRQLRRFAVEHREKPIGWEDMEDDPWCIGYDLCQKRITCYIAEYYREFGAIHFDSEETAKAAIKAFCDEILWYFTEYKDSM